MKNLYQYLENVEQSQGPQEGQILELVLNEELAVRSDIVYVDGNHVYIGLDDDAFDLLEAAGLMELAGDPGYTGSQGTALGGKPATPAAAAAQPAPSGARTATAGAKPIQSGAGLRAAQQQASAAGSPPPSPGYSKQYPVTNQMTAQMAQGTSGRFGTSTPPKAPAARSTGGGAPANANQAAVDAANAVQKGQMDKLAGNTPASAPDIEGMKQGIAAGSPAAQAAQTTEPTPAPQANAMGVMPQANVPGSPTATTTPTATTKELPITTTGGPTAANPTSVNTTPTQGGPAVAGTSNVSSRSADEIAADNKTPYGQYTKNQATKSYSSVGDFGKAIGNKLGITGQSSAPNTTPTTSTTSAEPAAPSTMAESNEFDRILQLAGVSRG